MTEKSPYYLLSKEEIEKLAVIHGGTVGIHARLRLAQWAKAEKLKANLN